jgi:hypothetical protein
MYKVLLLFLTITLFCPLLPPQDVPESPAKLVRLDTVKVGEIQANNLPLSEFLAKLSNNTKVAFCWENRYDEKVPADTLGGLRINIEIRPTDDVQTVLQRIQDAYPLVKWRIEEGIVVISAADIVPVPLSATVKPFAINGTVNDVLWYLNTHVPGLLADTIYVSGNYSRKEKYALAFSSDTTASQVLSRLTRDYGIRWYASVRDHGQALEMRDGPNGTVLQTGTTGRVTLMFHQGSVPLLVK